MREKITIPFIASVLILGNILIGVSYDDASAGIEPTDAKFCHSFNHDQSPPWEIKETGWNGWLNGHEKHGDILIDDFIGGGEITEEECVAMNLQNSLHVFKFYDANVNGVKDAEEPEIADWLVEIAQFQEGTDIIASSFTALTTVWIDPIDAEDYLVSEAQEDNWVPTNKEVPPILINEFNSDPSITIASNTRITVEGETIVEFGNVCLGEGGGHSKGFWTNKHGQDIIDGNDLADLNALNLVDESGSDKFFGTNSNVKNWLKDANAKNMAFMLSAQLAAMQLNVNHGFVDPTSIVYAPGVDENTDFLTIQDLMDLADSELDDHPDTTGDSEERDLQEAIKDALDNANNDTNFVQPDICEPFVAIEEPPV